MWRAWSVSRPLWTRMENSAFSLSQPAVLCQHTIPYDLRFSFFFFVVSWASPKSLRLSIGQAQHNAFIAQQRTHNTHLYDMKSRKNILRALNKKNINWCRLKAKTNKNYSRQFSLLSRFQQKFFACSLCFLMFLLIFFLSLSLKFSSQQCAHTWACLSYPCALPVCFMSWYDWANRGEARDSSAGVIVQHQKTATSRNAASSSRKKQKRVSPWSCHVV